MQEDGEKTPWWMWALLPLWLLVQVVSFVFVLAFTVWRILLALTIPIVVIAVVVILITGGSDNSTTTSTPVTASLGPDERYNEEAVAVLNAYQLYLRRLPKATPQNLDVVTPKQVRAEETAVKDFSALTPPPDLQQTHDKLLSLMRQEIVLSEEARRAFDAGEQKKINRLVSELSSGLVKYNRLGTEIYEAAEAERGQ